MSFSGRYLLNLLSSLPQGKRLIARLATAESSARALSEALSVSEASLKLARDEALLLTAESFSKDENNRALSQQIGDLKIRLELALQELDLAQIHLRDASDLSSRKDTQLSEMENNIAQMTSKLTHAEHIHSMGLGTTPAFPNGHFYSAIPSLDEVTRDRVRIFGRPVDGPIGVDLRVNDQLQLLKVIGSFQSDMPFQDQPTEKTRYGYQNPAYSYSDGIFLNGILRHFKPKRIVEVGSGYSSCMTLDTNDIWFDGQIDCTFIEPYPDLLFSLLRQGDKCRITVIPTRVQDVDLDVFRQLGENDVLFIDSTHVSKIGSDVNFLFLEVLPILASGVIVHVHDVFYPFEYPEKLLKRGIAWNEIYILRAILEQSGSYEILAMNTFLFEEYRGQLRAHTPLALKNSGGSIWFKKTSPPWRHSNI